MSRTIRNASKGNARKGRKGTKGDASPSPAIDPSFPLHEGETNDAYNARVEKRNELLTRLREGHTRNEGKQLRRRLRALGHFGGLRGERSHANALNVAGNVVDATRKGDAHGNQRNAC